MTEELKSDFERVLNALPGIVYGETAIANSSVSISSELVEIDLRFLLDYKGTSDRFLAMFVADRLDVDATEQSDGNSNASLHLKCNAKQASRLIKMLEYATALGMESSPPATVSENIALPVLLSHALLAFDEDYKNCDVSPLPSLPVWSNMLRAIDSRGVEQSEIERKAVIATRTRKVVLKQCIAQGWIELQKRGSPRPKSFATLTESGEKATLNGGRRIRSVERAWALQAPATYRRLRSALLHVVAKFDLEYPFYITGYGPADDSLTGGAYVRQKIRDDRVPAHGLEWPVVFRDSKKSVEKYPISVLLSQALAGYALDYEMSRLGNLGHVLKVFRYVDDNGVPLGAVREKGKITGGGRSLHERHLNVVLEPGKPANDSRLVYLTPKARRARDAYPNLVQSVEETWRNRFGKSAISELRAALEELDRTLPSNLPDYPDTTSWMSHWLRPYLI